MRLGIIGNALFLRCHSDVMALIGMKALVSRQGALRWQLFGFGQKLLNNPAEKSPNGLGLGAFA